MMDSFRRYIGSRMAFLLRSCLTFLHFSMPLWDGLAFGLANRFRRTAYLMGRKVIVFSVMSILSK